MDTNERPAGMPMPVRLSLLWTFIMFNMVFADILSFMYPGFLKEVMTGYAGGVRITPGFLLGAAVLTEIPLAMIVLSRVLKHPSNRWANIVAAFVTIVYVAGGSTTYPHGIFFTVVQVSCALLIAGYAWKWRYPDTVTTRIGTLPGYPAGASS